MPSKAESFIAGLPTKTAAIANALRQRIERVAPDAVPAMRMGVLLYSIDKKIYAGISADGGSISFLLPGTRGAFREELGDDTCLIGSSTMRYRELKRPA